MVDHVGVAEVAVWAAGLDQVHAWIAPRFSRSEPRERVAAYLRGLLAPLERKNGWTLTEPGCTAQSRWEARVVTHECPPEQEG